MKGGLFLLAAGAALLFWGFATETSAASSTPSSGGPPPKAPKPRRGEVWDLFFRVESGGGELGLHVRLASAMAEVGQVLELAAAPPTLDHVRARVRYDVDAGELGVGTVLTLPGARLELVRAVRVG